jgi:hypothetical protein
MRVAVVEVELSKRRVGLTMAALRRLCPRQQTSIGPKGLSASCQPRTWGLYSTTLLAVASSVAGTASPSAFAALRLIDNSNLET